MMQPTKVYLQNAESPHRFRFLSNKGIGLASKIGKYSFFRFFLNGGINALAVFSTIFIAEWASENSVLANTLGYIIGGGVGYLLHTQFTFRVKRSVKNAVIYFAIVSTGYVLNLVVLVEALKHLSIFIAQTVSIGFYLCYSYSLQLLLLKGKR